MLTFEEFFIKKKIDLVQLQQAEPALFAEFKKDFEPMGEKSFDHSKKFWFNKLRRTYHLKEEPKPAKTEIEITEIASQAEPLDSPTIEQKPAFKPRFNMKALADQQESKADEKPAAPGESAPEIASASKPAGFKPRFNMKAVAPQQEQKTEGKAPENTESSTTIEPASKPAGFKPRFNMKVVAPQQEEKTEEKAPGKTTELPEGQPVSTPRPMGFKPRFTKPKTEE